MERERLKKKKTIEVFINKGMTHGQKITFRGEADEAVDTTPGDVVVVLQVQEHPIFRRDGPNLFMKKKILLVEALTGFHFKITHLDSRTLVIKSSSGIIVKPGDIKAVRDEGMPMQKNPILRGSLYIEFDVEFPQSNSLSHDSISSLKKSLPPPPKEEVVEEKKEKKTHKKHVKEDDEEGNEEKEKEKDKSDVVEEVELEDVNMEQERAKFEEQHREKEAYEEDDEQHRRGHAHHTQGCRTQ